MQERPKLFMASSAKDGAVLDEVARQLASHLEPIPWTDTKGKMSSNLMEWLQTTVDRCRFGLFVLTPDKRWGRQANGNVLLELGLFAARHGFSRAFILTTERTPVPPDLAGILTARFDPALFRADAASALAPAIQQIRDELVSRQTLGDQILGPWLEVKEVGRKEGRFAVVNFYLERGRLKLKGRSFATDGEQRLEWPHELNHCWIPNGRDEVYHTFDSEYERGRHKALGVTRFIFEKNRKTGEGYFVVHGPGGITQGQIGFKLHRITPELLATHGLGPEFDFENRAMCEAFVRAVLARLPGPRKSKPVHGIPKKPVHGS